MKTHQPATVLADLLGNDTAVRLTVTGYMPLSVEHIGQSAEGNRSLVCCCCGERTLGRQWWNRDTGFGLCVKCADWIPTRGTTPEDMQSLYGIRGVHYALGPTSIIFPDPPTDTTDIVP